MSEKVKEIIRLMENIGVISCGIMTIISGIFIGRISPFLSIPLYIVSLVFILRGVSELMEIILPKENALTDDETTQDDKY